MPNNARLLLLDRNAVDALLVPDEVMQAVREAFALHSQHAARMFPVVREPLSGGGIFGIKSGDVPHQGLLGFKAAGFWPSNRQLGAEPHQATIVLFDPITGRPYCILDGNAITTVRTGAAGALGLQALARPDSTCITVFGTGVQARSQLAFALRTLPHICLVYYLTHNRQPDWSFEAEFAKQCCLHYASDANTAVSASDVIITATPGKAALFATQAVRPGTHLNCVGADTQGKRELPEGLLQKVRLVVDDKRQAQQLGELQWAPHTACLELGDLLTNTARIARFPEDITVFDMTGIALQDLTVARHIYQKASVSGLGTQIAWPW